MPQRRTSEAKPVRANHCKSSRSPAWPTIQRLHLKRPAPSWCRPCFLQAKRLLVLCGVAAAELYCDLPSQRGPDDLRQTRGFPHEEGSPSMLDCGEGAWEGREGAVVKIPSNAVMSRWERARGPLHPPHDVQRGQAAPEDSVNLHYVPQYPA
jgi:hypothetical protein